MSKKPTPESDRAHALQRSITMTAHLNGFVITDLFNASLCILSEISMRCCKDGMSFEQVRDETVKCLHEHFDENRTLFETLRAEAQLASRGGKLSS